METLTKQSIFDKVLSHSRQMTERCADKDGRCLYRGPNGNKCFIGALIPDEHYSKRIERTGGQHVISQLITDGVLKVEDDIFTPNSHINFIDELQRIHDDFFNQREQLLEKIAKQRGLNFTPLVNNNESQN